MAVCQQNLAGFKSFGWDSVQQKRFLAGNRTWLEFFDLVRYLTSVFSCFQYVLYSNCTVSQLVRHFKLPKQLKTVGREELFIESFVIFRPIYFFI